MLKNTDYYNDYVDLCIAETQQQQERVERYTGEQHNKEKTNQEKEEKQKEVLKEKKND